MGHPQPTRPCGGNVVQFLDKHLVVGQFEAVPTVTLAGTRAADDLCCLLASQLQRLAMRLGQKLAKQYVRIRMLKLSSLAAPPES